jgi:DNA-binding MltR family transcriptional regulator
MTTEEKAHPTFKIDDEVLDAAVEAMLAHLVADARKAIDQTKFDSSAMPAIFRSLHHESETSQVLVVASYLEDRITSLLLHQMVDVSSESSREKLFGSNGPLSTFGSRIILSYQLGWLSKTVVDRLNNFRKIRNIFAHNAFRVSYQDPTIRNLFLSLIEPLHVFDSTAVNAAKAIDKNNAVKRISEASEEQRNLCSMALLAGSVFRDLLVLPFAKASRLDPRNVGGGFNDAPEVVKELQRNVVRSALEILASSS